MFRVPEKNKNTLAGTRDKSISYHRPGEIEKKNYGSKRKKRPTSSEKKPKGYAVSGQKKTKKPP